MIKVSVLLFVCGLALAEEKQDTAQLCANIKKSLAAINSGAQAVEGGTDVEEVKKTVDGPQESSNINGNFTLLLIASDQNPLDSAARNCLKETAEQSAKIARDLNNLLPQLPNDKDKVLDVQRNLLSVSKLYDELLTPTISGRNRIQIALDSKKICKRINDKFNKIDSGATRIANGEDVNTVKAQVDGPQLASDIKTDYIRLSVVSRRVSNKAIEDCLAKVNARANQQRTQIEGILPQLIDDKDKVNAVFKDFTEINQLQQERDSSPPTKINNLGDIIKRLLSRN